MELVMKFINCTPYDFTAENGAHYSGYSCRCFDTRSKKIVKVKSDSFIDLEFGDDVTVDCVPNGRYLNYSIVG